MATNCDDLRRMEQVVLTALAGECAVLEERHGHVWNTAELQAEFQVLSFAAPYVVVRRWSDGTLAA